MHFGVLITRSPLEVMWCVNASRGPSGTEIIPAQLWKGCFPRRLGTREEGKIYGATLEAHITR